MGRRCACDGLLETARSDLRLRAIPAAARWLWLMLADQLGRVPETRVSSAIELSLMVSIAETEAETHLKTLLETGLILRRADGTLALPDAPEAPSRRGIGGRPRKTDTKESYRARQRELRLLGVHDGGVKTRETQGETHGEPPAACLAASLEGEASKQAEPRAPSFAELGEELAELAGLDPARGGYDFAVVKDWVGRGATADMLRQVVAQVAARPSYAAPRSLRYFGAAVADALRDAVPRVRSPAEEALRIRNDKLAAWINGGQEGPCPVELSRAS